MCKHVLNAQISIQAPCCHKWFDCSECHDTYMDHKMGYSSNLLLACHNCHLSFRKDFTIFGDKDETCPHCNNKYVRPARTPESEMFLEGWEQLDDMLRQAVDISCTIVSSSELENLQPVVDMDSLATMSAEGDAASESEKEKLERRKIKIQEAKMRRMTRNKAV